MQRLLKLDRNLIFGEFHNEAVIKTFLSSHMNEFYQQGYRILVGEFNENAPIGDFIDESLPQGSTLKALLQKAHTLVVNNDPTAPTLLNTIEQGLREGPWFLQGSDQASFALLVKTALANRMQVRLFDYIGDPGKKEFGTERVKNYDNDVALKLRGLNEKWLDLCGDEHVVGFVRLLGQGVVGFRHADLTTALTNRTLQNIQGLEQVPSL